MEGADVGFTYVAGHEEKDAEDTLALLAQVAEGRKATKYAADLGYDEQCKKVADAFLEDHGRIDILVRMPLGRTTSLARWHARVHRFLLIARWFVSCGPQE